MCANGGPVSDGIVRKVFLNSGLINREHWPVLEDYDEALDDIRSARTESCTLQERRTYVSLELETKQTLLYSAVFTREKSTGKEEMLAKKKKTTAILVLGKGR